MKLPQLLSFLFRRATAVPPEARHCVVQAGPPSQHEEAPLHGCGWFDSSHDLNEGLCVREHGSADSLAAELRGMPLAHWLELQLSGWRVTQTA